MDTPSPCDTWAPPIPPEPPSNGTPPLAAPPAARLPQLSAARWLAGAGASLLLVASIVVVAGNWESIDESVRFSGLVAALVAVYFVAEAARRRSPQTASALAALAAMLTAPVGIAAAATLSQPWPVCILVGGLASLIATEVQSRRWDIPLLRAVAVVSFGLAATGLAALISVPVALIGACGAVAALGLGAPRRAVALGLAVGASPVLVALAEAGVGSGTLARIGISGPETWVAPVSCSIAAVVIAVVAHRRGNAPLAVAALATFAVGAVSGILRGDVAPVVLWSIPATVLLFAELVGSSRTQSVLVDLGRRVSATLTFVTGLVALVVPYLAITDRSGGTAWLDGHGWVPLGLTALALVASATGSTRRAARQDATTAVAIAASAYLVAAVAAAGAPLWAVSVVALVCWPAISTVTPWTSWDVPTAIVATWVLIAEIVDGGSAVVRIGLVVTAGVAVVTSLTTTKRKDEGFRLIGAAVVVGVTAGFVAGGNGVDVGVVTFLGLLVIGIGLRPSTSVGPLVVAGLLTQRLAFDRSIGWLDAVATALLACCFAASARDHDIPDAGSARLHVAAGLAALAGGFAVMCTDLDAGTATLAASTLAIALTGISLVDRRFGPVRTAGLVAAAIGVVFSLDADPAFTSVAVTVLGAQAALVGLDRRWRITAAPGVALAVGGVVSLWWTTGTNAWAIAAIAPYGASGTDLAVGVAVGALLTAGGAIRRKVAVSSWLAYGPGLAMAGTWLIASQLEAGSDWATLGALAVGTVAVGVGGVRRLAAPLVIGSIMLIGTLAVSAGPRLATAPTWSWIAGGGVALLIVAALVERSERPLLPVGRRNDDAVSLVEQFCEEFQ